MGLILLPTALFLLCLLFLGMVRPLRLAIVLALLAFESIVALSCELLSLFRCLTFWPIVIVWLFVIAAAGVGVWLQRSTIMTELRRILHKLRDLDRDGSFFAGAILFNLAIVFVIAVVAPPNNHDSMTYHLPRVMQWMQNRTIAHFPVQDFRLIEYSPGAEEAILHVMVLSRGSDRCVNLVQWFAWAGLIAAVSLIAREFRAARRGQLAAGLFAATMPMAILQGSSTQNDLVVAFCVVAFALFLLILQRHWPRGSLVWTLCAGACLGLSWYVKGTSYVYTLPFCIQAAWWGLRREATSRVQAVGAIAVLALAVNLGCYLRNHEGFFNPLRSPGSPPVMVEVPTPALAVSNIVRNIATEIATPIDRINHLEWRIVVALHRVIGVDASDERSTYPNTRFAVTKLRADEDSSANPLHFLLACAALIGLLFVKLDRVHIHTFCLVGGILFFCTMLRWQPWHARLHIAFFMLAAPIVGLVADRFMGRRILLIGGLALWLASMPWVLLNNSRPILKRRNIFNTPRNEQMFFKHQELHDPYRHGAEFLKSIGAQRIGLAIGGDVYEYPLWPLMHGTDVEMKQVLMRNWTPLYLREDPFHPDVVAVLGDPDTEPIIPDGTQYEMLFHEPGFMVIRVTRWPYGPII